MDEIDEEKSFEKPKRNIYVSNRRRNFATDNDSTLKDKTSQANSSTSLPFSYALSSFEENESTEKYIGSPSNNKRPTMCKSHVSPFKKYRTYSRNQCSSSEVQQQGVKNTVLECDSFLEDRFRHMDLLSEGFQETENEKFQKITTSPVFSNEQIPKSIKKKTKRKSYFGVKKRCKRSNVATKYKTRVTSPETKFCKDAQNSSAWIDQLSCQTRKERNKTEFKSDNLPVVSEIRRVNLRPRDPFYACASNSQEKTHIRSSFQNRGELNKEIETTTFPNTRINNYKERFRTYADTSNLTNDSCTGPFLQYEDSSIQERKRGRNQEMMQERKRDWTDERKRDRSYEMIPEAQVTRRSLLNENVYKTSLERMSKGQASSQMTKCVDQYETPRVRRMYHKRKLPALTETPSQNIAYKSNSFHKTHNNIQTFTNNTHNKIQTCTQWFEHVDEISETSSGNDIRERFPLSASTPKPQDMSYSRPSLNMRYVEIHLFVHFL